MPFIFAQDSHLNEGRRQKAGGRRISCRGIQTHPQLLTAAAWRLPTLPLAKAMRSTRMEIMAGALNPKVRREKEGLNLLRRLEPPASFAVGASKTLALQLLPSKAEALVNN